MDDDEVCHHQYRKPDGAEPRPGERILSGMPSQQTQLVASRGWKVRHSLWVLAPILGVGVLSFVGFIYCAIRTRERKWATLASISVVLTLVAWIFIGTWTDSAGNLSSAASTYVVELWLASIVFAFFVNRDYLAWRAEPSRSASQEDGGIKQLSQLESGDRNGGYVPVGYGILGRPGGAGERFISPGYYDDPQSSEHIRWWDGYAWTGETAPKPPRS